MPIASTPRFSAIPINQIGTMRFAALPSSDRSCEGGSDAAATTRETAARNRPE